MSDWWHLGWSFKCAMLEKWLGNQKEKENINILTEDEYWELNQRLNAYDKLAEIKVEEWTMIKNNNN